MVTEAAAADMKVEARMSAIMELVRSGSAEDLRRNERLQGACQRVADDPKYRAIFQDPTLSHYVIRRIYMLERDSMVPYLVKNCHLSHSEADKLFMMIVYGLFYVNRSMKWMKDDSWYEMQMTLNRFMFGGFDALRKM